MSDYISRQAAAGMKLIDGSVLKEWVENWFTKNRFYHPYAKNNNIPITELYDILELIPPAVSPVRNWIPVSKDLPKNPIRVQVQLDNSWIITAYYDEGEWYAVPGDNEPIDEVLAWMLLPEPYIGEEK